MYSLADTGRHWYLRVKEELIKVGATASSVNPGLFYRKEHYEIVGILACYVGDIILGGNKNFNLNFIDNYKNSFMFGLEETKAFTYLGI